MIRFISGDPGAAKLCRPLLAASFLSAHIALGKQGSSHKDTLNCYVKESLRLPGLVTLSTMTTESTHVCQIPSLGPITRLLLTTFVSSTD